MSNEFIFQHNSVSLKKLQDFYDVHANDFIPCLSEQVSSVTAYVHKIWKKAELFEVWQRDELIGLVAVYFNNLITKEGFITSVLIDSVYRHHHLALALLQRVIQRAEYLHFSRICLEVAVHNIHAVTLYQKLGFVKVREKMKNMGGGVKYMVWEMILPIS